MPTWVTDTLQHPLFLSGGLILTWITIGLTLFRFGVWERRKVAKEVVGLDARRVADEKEATAADVSSATRLLEVVNYMIGLIDRLDQRVQKEISESIDELKRLVSDRINALERRVDALSDRLDRYDEERKKDG